MAADPKGFDYTIGGDPLPLIGSASSTSGFDYTLGGEPLSTLIVVAADEAQTLGAGVATATATAYDGVRTATITRTTLAAATATATAYDAVRTATITRISGLAEATATGNDGVLSATITLIADGASATATAYVGGIEPGASTQEALTATATATAYDGGIFVPENVSLECGCATATATAYDGLCGYAVMPTAKRKGGGRPRVSRPTRKVAEQVVPEPIPQLEPTPVQIISGAVSASLSYTLSTAYGQVINPIYGTCRSEAHPTEAKLTGNVDIEGLEEEELLLIATAMEL